MNPTFTAVAYDGLTVRDPGHRTTVDILRSKSWMRRIAQRPRRGRFLTRFSLEREEVAGNKSDQSQKA